MSKKRKDPIDYIRLRLIGGYSKEKVQELLKRKGWSEEEIEQGIKEAEKRISEMPKRLMLRRLVLF